MKLTCTPSITKIPPPQHEVGFRSSFITGDNSPQSLRAVFLCLSFFSRCIFALITFIMVVLFGQPLRLVSPVRDTANPLNTAANCFAVLRDGFTHSITGITA